MISKYNGFEPAKISSSERLPAGGYVCTVLESKIETYDFGQKLAIYFDILEGPYAGYYTNQYKSSTFEGKKWKGVIRFAIPNESSQYFASEKRRFENLIACLEESNDGFHFDWDESKIVKKRVGIIFRNKEYDFEGKRGWFTEPFSVTDVESIREEKFKIPADKPLATTEELPHATFISDNGAPPPTDADLPF